MSKPIPSYLFHVPHMDNMIDYEQLETLMTKRNPPEMVHVRDANSQQRLGRMHPAIALVKFR
jgi:hypothetical protein